MISVTILTKNSEKYLEEILITLNDFDEVLLLDNGSKDNTLNIAKKFKNTTIRSTEFIGFGKLHNLAIDLAKNDWILSIDSDEIPSKALIKEILTKKLDPGHVYSIVRHNYFNDKFIRWCGWYPETVLRLFNKQKTRFTESEVHEKVIIGNLKEACLKNPLKHYPYASITDFLRKMQHYSELFAKQNKGKKKSSPLKAICHGTFAFFKSYFIKRGFLGGYEGFLISMYNGHTAFYKYLKLFEANEIERKNSLTGN